VILPEHGPLEARKRLLAAVRDLYDRLLLNP
jgi:hypothetical protein